MFTYIFELRFMKIRR